MKITQSIDLKKKDGFLFINAILLMGFFIDLIDAKPFISPHKCL